MAAKPQIALLRGINLGATRRISMPELRELLTHLGYGDVRTLVNSGNVVLTSGAKPGTLEKKLEKEIASGLGVDTRVLVRTRDELADVIERNPFPKGSKEPKLLHVAFLDAKPKAAVVKELAKEEVAPEAFVIDGRELYSWHPNGLGRSNLSALLSDKRLGVVSTRRNWNTVTKLLEMADE
jgi:uncharacterized protein (DUF1697 family)